MKTLKFIGVVLAIFVIGYAIDWIASREERAVLEPIQSAFVAIEKKDWAAFEAELDAEFSYGSSVSWVGEGRLEESRAKLESFWPRMQFLGIVLRESKAEVIDERSAKAELSGNVKSQISDGAGGGAFVIYKFRAAVQLREVSGVWKLLRVDIPQLEPGIF